MSDHHDNFRLQGPEFEKMQDKLSRRNFLTKTSLGLGAVALSNLFGLGKAYGASKVFPSIDGDSLTHFAPKAKRIVYLFQSGGPSQFETFDYKPALANMFGDELPGSVRKGQRLTSMSASQSGFPIAPSIYEFDQ